MQDRCIPHFPSCAVQQKCYDGAIMLAPSEILRSIALDDAAIRRNAPEAEAEREAALADLLSSSHFAPHCFEPSGPYDVRLSARDNRLRFHIASEKLTEPREVMLPISPFRRIVKDYFIIFESHQEAVHSGQTHRLEAIDMARRGVHNEGAELLQSQLDGRISLDFDTARRLFTLICILHIA
jgi:uncharacterized protein (UPF0262 family)